MKRRELRKKELSHCSVFCALDKRDSDFPQTKVKSDPSRKARIYALLTHSYVSYWTF